MESHTLIQDKLSEWNLSKLINRFEDEQINDETFLSLDTSAHLEVLIPKTGPRVKFRKRLQEYKQSLNRQHEEEMMETNVDSHHMSTVSFPSQSLVTQQGILATQLFLLRHHLTIPVQEDLMTVIKSIIPTFTADSIFNTDKIKVYKGICRSGFFLFSSLKDLLKDTLDTYGLMLLPKLVNLEDEIGDIMGGKMYQKLIENKTVSNDDITFLWNCDAAPVEQESVWSLQLTINELPNQIRKQNVLVPALWCGKGAPDMAEFLKPFINECLELAKAPLRWIDGNGTAHFSRVFVLVCSSDAVARPLLQNSIQFNGEYGCDWCLHPGTVVDKGSGKVRSYAYDQCKPRARCEKMYQADAIRAKASGKPVNGVKGDSVLQALPIFDIVQGFVPEYSHAVLLGMTKQLVFLWLEDKNSTEPWYIGNREDELDARLFSLRPALNITRSSISLKCREKWKAEDWQAFLLFYGIYVLKPYLAPRYLHHFYRLSCSVHILLQDTIAIESLKCAHVYLEDFVKEMAVLYDAEGIEKMFSIWQHVPNHLRSFVFSNLDFNDLIKLNSPQNVYKVAYAPVGPCCHIDINDSTKSVVQDLLKDTGQVSAYERFTNGHRVYHCANSKATNKTKCTVKLNNGYYGEIHLFLEVKCPSTGHVCQVIVVKRFDTSPVFRELNMELSTHAIFVKGNLTEELRAFYIHSIKSECVCVSDWIVHLPSLHERY
ncbi:uncharacterized protein LOC117375568 isoform X2 [Periophthalmus magnuspinnatus]|uniref:uncharacterized protein LOC117375568 isoform X2 n=1 Tax=Periophthalmus magnuspinnatus TaxID=409849 RepID=UPI00243656DD|nr:uncharacterized protein LOC117375568 isoform X2 [Periophthalmus magnuspinnatus]